MLAFFSGLLFTVFAASGISLAEPFRGPLRVQQRPPFRLLPDLDVENIRLNSDCNVVVKIRNNGPGRLPDDVWNVHTPQSAGVYLTIDGRKWGGETIWSFDPSRALQNPGGTAKFISNLKVSGNAVIKAEIDLWNVVAERNEANNTSTKTLVCGSGSGPASGDLDVKIFGCPISARPGQDLGSSFKVNVKSTFGGSLSNVAVDLVLTSAPVYASPAPYAVYSANYSSGVLLKGGREHESFGGPGVVTVKLNGSNTIPADTPPGDYYLGAVVDAGNNVPEINESNNASFCKIMVLPGFANIPHFPLRPPFPQPQHPIQPVQEDCITFNPNTIEVRQIGGSWKIVDGSHWMFDFGANKAEADQTFNIIRHYGMNSICYVGRPDPSFTYLLVSGSAPAGGFPGGDCIGFNPATIEVKEIGGRWKIVDGDQWMFDFASNKAEAVTAFNIIKKYGFRYSCFVGRPDPSFIYMRK